MKIQKLTLVARHAQIQTKVVGTDHSQPKEFFLLPQVGPQERSWQFRLMHMTDLQPSFDRKSNTGYLPQTVTSLGHLSKTRT